MIAPADVVALMAAIVVDRSVLAPEVDRISVERRALRRARRLYAMAHGLKVAEAPPGSPSGGVVAE